MAIKVCAHGARPGRYLKDSWNVFDWCVMCDSYTHLMTHGRGATSRTRGTSSTGCVASGRITKNKNKGFVERPSKERTTGASNNSRRSSRRGHMPATAQRNDVNRPRPRVLRLRRRTTNAERRRRTTNDERRTTNDGAQASSSFSRTSSSCCRSAVINDVANRWLLRR